MPLRLSAAEMTTAATSVKSVLSSATTRRWVDKRVTSSQLAAMCMDFISANARIGSVKSQTRETLPNDVSGSDGFSSDRRTSVKADASDLTVALQ